MSYDFAIRYHAPLSLSDRIGRKSWSVTLCSIGCGALQVLAFAPFDWWFIQFVSIIPLLWAFEYLPKRKSYWCAFWYGTGFWVATTHWIYYSFTHFATAPLVLSALLVLGFAMAMALFFVGLCWLWHRVNRPFGFYGYLPAPVWLKCLLFAASWLVVEWVRSTVFQGFPWLLLGYSGMDVPLVPFTNWLPVGGVWVLSFIWALLIASTFYMLHALVRAKSSWGQRVRSILYTALVFGAIVGGSFILPDEYSQPNGRSVRVGLVQPSIPLAEKWSSRLQTRNLLIMQQLSLPLRDQVEAIVWPESSIAGIWKRRQPLLRSISQSLAPAALISGTLRQGQGDLQSKVFNSIGNFTSLQSTDSDAQEPTFYDKRQLVPFGEFMPLYSVLSGTMRWLGFPVSSLSASQTNDNHVSFGGMQFGAAICYEIIFPRLFSRGAWKNDAILNISDDGWFGDSIGPKQHFQMARARALENDRQVFRVGNDGLTALIDHRGAVVASLPRFARDTLVVTIEGREGRTPLSYMGDWVVLVLVLPVFLVYFGLRVVWRKRIE